MEENVTHAPEESGSNDGDATTTVTAISHVSNEISEIGAALTVLHDLIPPADPPDQAEEDLEQRSVPDAEVFQGNMHPRFTGAGSYVFKSCENVDQYLTNLGVGLVFRKVQLAADPMLTICPATKEGQWIMKTDSIFRTREIKFQMGEEFTDETYDGRPCRSVITVETPARLHMHQRCPTGPDVKTDYELQQDNSLVVVMNAGPNRAELHFVPNLNI